MSSSPRTTYLMLSEKLANYEAPDSASSKIFHDTAGWKNLETWMKLVALLFDQLGRAYNIIFLSFLCQGLKF